MERGSEFLLVEITSSAGIIASPDAARLRLWFFKVTVEEEDKCLATSAAATEPSGT